jgi:cell division protein FtsL
MAAVAPQVRAEPVQPVVRRRARPDQPRVAGGVVWIVVIAVLLAGVVFMNVVVLRMNISLDRLGRERAQLQGDNAALASNVSSELAAARIQAQARKDLGVVPADPSETVYVDLPARP